MSLYLPDKESTVDKLSYQDYVNSIASLIKSSEIETPITIGIFGPWGSGKSTMINLIENSLKNEKNIFKARFNPWQYKDEPNLLVPLFKTIIDSKDLEPRLKKISDAIKRTLAVSFMTAGEFFFDSLTSKAQTMGELYERQTDIRSHKKFESVNFNKELRVRFEAVVDKLVGDKGKLIIFIDDLDRCNQDTIIDLLESIKLFLSVEKCIFIICADYEVIKQGLKRKFESFDGVEDYIEKLVQIPFFIPSLTKEQIRSFIDKEVARGLLIDEIKAMLVKFVPPIPRKIKRIINLLSFHQELALIRLGGEYSQNLLLKTIILQQRFNDLFRYFDNNKGFLVSYEKNPSFLAVDKTNPYLCYIGPVRIAVQDAELINEILNFKPYYERIDIIDKYFSLISAERETTDINKLMIEKKTISRDIAEKAENIIDQIAKLLSVVISKENRSNKLMVDYSFTINDEKYCIDFLYTQIRSQYEISSTGHGRCIDLINYFDYPIVVAFSNEITSDIIDSDSVHDIIIYPSTYIDTADKSVRKKYLLIVCKYASLEKIIDPIVEFVKKNINA